MKRYLPIAVAVGLLSFGITNAAATVPWARSGTSEYPLYIGDNIGIGTTTPTSPLTVYSAGTTSPYAIIGGVQPLLQIGSTSPTYGYLANDRLNINDFRNDYSADNSYNLSSGICATADKTVANDLNSTALNFGDFGHTSSNFTGSGCANNPFTGFGANSTYLFDPSGSINMAIGTSSSASQFRWFTGGYGAANQKMVLTNGGNLGIGSTSPNSTLTVNGGTITANTNAVNVVQTWNNAAVNFTAVKVNVTTTAALSGLLFDFQSAGTSRGSLDQFGNFTTVAVTAGNGSYIDFSGLILAKSAGVIGFSPNSVVAASNHVIDTGFSRLAAAKVALGNGTASDTTGTFITANIGIGSTTPYAPLSLDAASTTDAVKPIATFAGFENTVRKLFMQIGQWGEQYFQGDVPAVSSCGTSPTVSATSNMVTGSINVGTGVVSNCTVTFAHPFKSGSVPHVFLNLDTGSIVSVTAQSITSTGFIIGSSGTFGGDVISYNVIASQ